MSLGFSPSRIAPRSDTVFQQRPGRRPTTRLPRYDHACSRRIPVLQNDSSMNTSRRGSTASTNAAKAWRRTWFSGESRSHAMKLFFFACSRGERAPAVPTSDWFESPRSAATRRPSQRRSSRVASLSGSAAAALRRRGSARSCRLRGGAAARCPSLDAAAAPCSPSHGQPPADPRSLRSSSLGRGTRE